MKSFSVFIEDANIAIERKAKVEAERESRKKQADTRQMNAKKFIERSKAKAQKQRQKALERFSAFKKKSKKP